MLTLVHILVKNWTVLDAFRISEIYDSKMCNIITTCVKSCPCPTEPQKRQGFRPRYVHYVKMTISGYFWGPDWGVPRRAFVCKVVSLPDGTTEKSGISTPLRSLCENDDFGTLLGPRWGEGGGAQKGIGG